MNPCGAERTASKAVPELVCKCDVPQLVLHFSGSSLSGKNADLGAAFAVRSEILYLSLVAFCFKATAYPCVCLLVLAAVSGHDSRGAKQDIHTKCQHLILINSFARRRPRSAVCQGWQGWQPTGAALQEKMSFPGAILTASE